MKNSILTFILLINIQIFAQNRIQYIESVPDAFKENYYKQPHNYNPLHVGDIWQFSSSERYFLCEIIRDTLINGKLYYEKQTNFTTTLERNDTNKQSSYLYDIDDLDLDGFVSEELLLDSLDVSNFSQYISYRLISKDDLPDVPPIAFVEDSSWAIVFGDTVMTRRTQYFCCFTTQVNADKFGVVWTMTEGPPNFLVGAIINGVTYGTIVSTNEEKPDLPKEYFLSNNYPNPFNPSTTITFTIPQREFVTLKVYNTLGKEVAALVNGYKEAGKYSVGFNAEGLPSGIYFYTLRAGKYTQTRKMAAVK